MGKELQIPDTYRIGSISYRKSDNAIAGIYNKQERAEGKTFEEAALNYLDKNKIKFGFEGSIRNHLKHYFTYDGNDLVVVRFQQTYKGLLVDDNQIIVTMSRSKEVVFLLNHTRPVRENVTIQSQITEKAAFLKAISSFGPVSIPPQMHNEKIIHFIDNKPVLCYRIRFSLKAPLGDWMTFIDAGSNTIIRQYNNLHPFQTSGSGAGTGNIFNPDPISSSGATYGSGGFVHGNDANTTDLQGQLMSVTFPIGTQFSGPAYLQGPRAYNNMDSDPCYSSTADWSFNRADDCFEAVMCYYHIDKVMAHYYSYGTAALSPYQNQSLSTPEAVRFESNQGADGSGAYYNSGDGSLLFIKFENAQNETIDAAEDAAVIIHELGHGINDWMAPGGISEVEGLGEGFADYWAQSYTRSLGLWNENQAQYQRVCNWFMFNDVVPTNLNRTTNFIVSYPNNLPAEGHLAGQLFSTVMMSIYDDIGKDKADYIAMKGISQTGSVTEQWEAAEAIFSAAVSAKNNNVNIKNAGIFITTSDLCIIYENFEDVYGDKFNPTPPEGQGDYYIRDTPADLGSEPNPDQGPMWRSEDIWIRSGEDDGETVNIHENPVYGEDNFIYVRLRSRDCVPLTQGVLRVYFSKASTILTWPDFWEDHYVQTPGGMVLAGDEVDGSPVSLPDDMRAGEERIIKFAWNNMPNPGNFPFNRHHFCLLARIESAQDPMESTETGDVAANARDNNNVAWKNVSILGGTGPIRDGTVYICQIDGASAVVNTIHIGSPGLPGYKPCQEQGDLYVRLQNGLQTIWQNNGSEGEGFALQMDGRLKITGTSAVIEGLAMATGTPYYLTVEYSPGTNARPCICDVEQRDQQDYIVGGERFIYDPDHEESFGGGGNERSQIKEKKTDHLHIYPVPTEDVLYVEFESAPEDIESNLSIFDSRGVLQIQKNIATQHPNNILRLDVKQLHEGLYSLQIANTGRKSVKSIRFIKL